MTAPVHPEDFEVKEPLILIFIGRSIGKDLTQVHPPDVYAAVHGRWKIDLSDDEQTRYRLVLARNTNRILGAFRPREWRKPAGSRMYFFGEPAELSVQLDYVGKRVPNRFRVQRPAVRWNPGD